MQMTWPRLKDARSLSEYLLQIDALTCQFKSSFPKLNTTRVNVWRGINKTPKPIFIGNQEVNIVNSFTYLGTLLD